MTDSHLTLYVSPTGDDTTSGESRNSPDGRGPLRSLHAALGRIRDAQTQPSRADVVILSGTHPIDRSIEISGVSGCSITIRSDEPGGARLIGGSFLESPIPYPETDTGLRIPESSRPHLLCFDVSAFEVTSLTSRGFGRDTSASHTELFQDHRRLQLARFPERDSLRISSIPSSNDDDQGGIIGPLENGFFVADPRPQKWQCTNDVWIHGYWAWDWADTYERIDLYRPQTGQLKTRPPHGVYGFREGQPFYFLNIAEELVSPGSYFVDPTNGHAFVWPNDPAGEIVVSVMKDPLIHIEKSKNVTLDGLVIEYGKGNGIQICEGSNITIQNTCLRNLGNTGIVIEDGHRHRVTGCEISSVGESAIEVSGGNRKALERSDHEISHNHIHHYAEWVRCYRPGVKLSGVGITVSNNHIHDAPHNAILLSGNEHLIEKNHIHDVCTETGDVGAFYMGRDWTERGNTIRYNLIHDIRGIGSRARAIYLDDCASGTIVHGNVFYNCTMAVFIGGGRNHRVTNNIFIDCDPAVVVDGRGASEKDVWARMLNDIMRPRFESMNPLSPPYSVRYPDLKEVAAYYQHELGIPPEGHLISRNICVGEWLQIRDQVDSRMLALQYNFTDGDPGFRDLSARDFRLDEDAEVFELGFKRIPLEEIGPQVVGD
ncbi:MAG: hypothetical protein CME21_01080 [Gemmatimonadetes bacterium]|nr:hypothetical protein [Gemmatimonadota bacterium]HCK11066.1 hypothetical protein [Candidatus Latescibacterota bacterium]